MKDTAPTVFEKNGTISSFDPDTRTGIVKVDGGRKVEFSSRHFHGVPRSRHPSVGEDVSILFSPRPDALLSVQARGKK